METAHPFIGGNRAAREGGAAVATRLGERKTVTIGAEEAQALLTEDFLGLQTHDTVGRQALLPKSERSFGHREDGLRHLARAASTRSDVRKREIGHHRARGANLVPVVEVIDIRRVEIDGLLDPAQAERLGEEGVVHLGIRGHRGDVVEAFDLAEHGSSSWRFGAATPVLRSGIALDGQDAHGRTKWE
jgi:hypothetical protein